MRTVGLLLFDDVLMLDAAGPIDVFSLANRYLPADKHYRLMTISPMSKELRASNGLRMFADYSIEEAPTAYDVLLVPGGPGAYSGDHRDIATWLRGTVDNCCTYGSVCTGAFLLGEAGLLDGRRVTTHWHYQERLATRFPNARVQSEEIYLRDGAMISCGGVTAGIDLALSVLTEHHGKSIALDVAKVLLVVTQRQGGQTQFSPMLSVPKGENDTLMQAIQRYVIDNVGIPHTVSALAEIANMSPRNFSRVFTRETGLSPMEFVLTARIDSARNLLESTDLPLKTIAARSGFGSTRQMRALFSARLKLSPAQYRFQFG
jgi:transcriptional regulator GlxA family with amidase domain